MIATDEQFAKDVAQEATDAGRDAGLQPSEVANALVQAAMQVLETNPPQDHAIRPMWLADSVATIRQALDSRVESVVGASELMAGTLSPLTLAVLAAMILRSGTTKGLEWSVDLTKVELANSLALTWEFHRNPDILRLIASRRMDNPQNREGGSA